MNPLEKYVPDARKMRDYSSFIKCNVMNTLAKSVCDSLLFMAESECEGLIISVIASDYAEPVQPQEKYARRSFVVPLVVPVARALKDGLVDLGYEVEAELDDLTAEHNCCNLVVRIPKASPVLIAGTVIPLDTAEHCRINHVIGNSTPFAES